MYFTKTDDGKMTYTTKFLTSDEKTISNRIYPFTEVEKATDKLLKLINEGETIFGEADHPENLEINLDRASHIIKSIWYENQDWYANILILPTPLGKMCRTLLESGLELRLSPRGTGIVSDCGIVSDFEIVTLDLIASPAKPILQQPITLCE